MRICGEGAESRKWTAGATATGDVIKTSVEAMYNLKNLVGSVTAGSAGGFNAHAVNILTAMFLAKGQNPAQNVESSNCMALMEPTNDGRDLLMTVTMPSIEVGIVGGGTILVPQEGRLEMLSMKGANHAQPRADAQQLARFIAAAVMAGELWLVILEASDETNSFEIPDGTEIHRLLSEGAVQDDYRVTLTDVTFLKKTENNHYIFKAKTSGEDVIVKFTYEDDNRIAIPRLQH
ncbi:hypothetical protein C0993_011270, partial [Termitomyces sp. T159_Od127]